ncbi:MAG TPA: chemotaxis protein CheB, partial [Burkholderiales bacterium]
MSPPVFPWAGTLDGRALRQARQGRARASPGPRWSRRDTPVSTLLESGDPGAAPSAVRGSWRRSAASRSDGLEALTQVFSHLPGDTGMAFVVIQHLDPTHRSMLRELLSRGTPMPAVEVKEGMEVLSDHVYVIPPNAHMAITDGRRRGFHLLQAHHHPAPHP